MIKTKVPWFERLPARRKKQILWSTGLVIFYTVFGFLILPPIVRNIATKEASKALQREVSIQKVLLNPYSLSATVRGLLVKDKDGEPFVSWDEVYANFQLSSIFSGGWDFRELRLKSPYARVQVNKDGTLNFSDLLATTNPPAPQTAEKPRPVRAGSIRLTNVVVSFTDLTLSTPFSTKAGIVELVVDRFSTAADIENPYSFAGTTVDGESFSWKGDFSLDPLRSRGEIKFGGLPLKKYRPYHEDKANFEIRDGNVAGEASYRIALGGASNLVQITNASITVTDLKIGRKGRETNVVEIPLTTLAGARCDLFARIAELKSFSTKNAWINARRFQSGKINLAELFAEFPAAGRSVSNRPALALASTNAAPWVANIGTVFVEDYTFDLHDLATPRPVHLGIEKFNLALTNLSTRPGTNTSVNLSMRWNTNGTFRTEGTVALFPPSGELKLKLENVGLLPLDHYLDGFLNLAIHRGAVGVDGVAKFALPTNGPMEATFRGDFHLDDFESKEVPAGVDFARWRSLALRGIDFRLGSPPTAIVGELTLVDPFLRFEKDARTNNLLAIIRERSPGTNSTVVGTAGGQTGTASLPPLLTIGALTISNGTAQFSDTANPRPVRLLVQDLGVRLKNVSNQPGTNIDVAVSLHLNTNGLVKAEGTVALFPPTLDLKLNLDGVALRPVDPYLDPFVNLLITRGAIGIDGRAKAAMPSNGPVTAAFQGDVRLRDFATVDGVLNEEFVKWSDLNLRGLDFQLDPMAVSLREVGVNDLLLRFVLGKDTNNVAGLVKRPAATASTGDLAAPATPPASPASGAAPAPKFDVSSLVLSNASLEFKDTSITPTALLSVRQLSGRVGDLSSERVGSGTLDLKGKVDNTAPFEIAGKVSLFTREKNSDIKMGFRDVEMTPLGPYIAKFLGYRLTKGRLNVNLEALIQGRKVDAKNLVVFDQFTLGESVPGTNAVKAPIKLALAIMKDSEGKIELDLPVQGDLDDPNYRYGKILWRAMGNIFLKAATSPFGLLGAAFGGKGEELSFQDFDPGLVELKPENAAKLDTVAKALQNRPALSLDIKGSFDPAADTDALRREKLARGFRAKKFEALRASGQTAVAPEDIKLAPDDYTNAVVLAYLSAVPTNAVSAANLLAGNPALTNQVPSASPAPKPAMVPPPVKEPTAAPPRPVPSRRGAAGLFSVPTAPQAPASARTEAKMSDPVPVPPPASILSVTNLVAIAAARPFAEMEKALLDKVEVTEGDLSLLAAGRAKTVKEYLLEKGQIAPERLFIAENAGTETSTNRASRVFLQLK